MFFSRGRIRRPKLKMRTKIPSENVSTIPVTLKTLRGINMATMTEIVEDFNTRMPENVVRQMENIIHENSVLLATLAEHLPAEKHDQLSQSLNYLIAFFNYVSPFIEPIAYGRLDETFLVRQESRQRLERVQAELMELFRYQQDRKHFLLDEITSILEDANRHYR